MLEKVRKPGRAKNIIAYIIFGAICLVFVFLGIGPSQFGQFMTGGAAAVVNSKPISLADFQRSVQQQEAQFQGQLEAIPETQRQAFRSQIRQRALNSLISRELVSQEAHELGVIVSDKQVRDRIISYEPFQEEGHFRREKYEGVLKANGLNPKSFEEDQRRDLRVSSVQNLFAMALRGLDIQSEKRKAVESTLLDISYLSFDQNQLEAGYDVSGLESKKFMESDENLQKMKSYYEQNRQQFNVQEQVEASHILIAFKEAGEAAQKSAFEKIQKVAERLKTEDFSAVAKEVSDDKGSAEKGGYLGFFGKGRMVPEFEQAAFALKKGEVSEPVKTQFGYHILKVSNKVEAEEKTFEDVKKDIAVQLIKSEEAERALAQIQEQLDKGETGALKSFVSKFDLEWDQVVDVSLGAEQIPGVGESKRVFDLLLSKGEPGKIIPEIQRIEGMSYIFRLDKISSDSDVPLATNNYLADRRQAIEAFNAWLNKTYRQARIQRNESILGN